ncbi:hypothetical protein C4553_03535 [Candidatus Parcubacteria bacterium]|nr:MAG: hypothetical protein C4553_03535 [Candidatus Parcubacteria bacterium]
MAALAIFLFHWSKVPEKYKRILLAASITLFLFGISDFVEIKTMGFWESGLWWLLAWKAVCLVALFVITIWFFKAWLKRP